MGGNAVRRHDRETDGNLMMETVDGAEPDRTLAVDPVVKTLDEIRERTELDKKRWPSTGEIGQMRHDNKILLSAVDAMLALDIRTLAHAWMKYVGYTEAQIAEAENWTENDLHEDCDTPPELVRDLDMACDFAREIMDPALRQAASTALTSRGV